MIAIKDFGRSVLRAKLPGVRTIGKRAVLSTVPLSLFLGLVMASIPAELARAAVPNMRWNDSTTIEVYGGDLSGTNSYKLINQANRNAGIAFYGETIVTHKDNCQLKLAAQVTEGKNGAETDWSKAMLWVMAPGSGKNCFTEGSHTENRATYYDMGIESGSKLYTITDVNNRGKQGEEQTPAVVDDPEDKQIIKVALYPGWTNIYTTPNPSSPPKADELVPQEDLWTLCGNSNDPTKSWDPYRSSLGTPNYDQMEKDCLARKNGWVISSTRGPIKTQSSEPRISYSGQFTGVKFGDYTICDFITNSCRHEHKQPNKILTVDSWKTPANPLAKVPGAATDTEGTVNEPELACDITWDLSTVFSLKWLVCPVVNAATAAVGAMEDVINNLLTVDTKDIFNDSDTNNAYHTAWNSFRAFALGLIVIAALIMVVSQAAGIEILDAYTVRKVLPRLLFAAIFIALSWDILEFLTSLSNDAGTGIRTLIYAPFQALNKNNQLGGGSTYVLALIGTGGALAFGWLGLLSFALTGLLAAMIAFAILVFRKMLILLLLMMAPFAIACYVLPNTQKGWEIWKGGLLSALIVFPIISAFIAIGRVFSITAFNSPGIQTVNQIIAVIAYFAPYFLISMAFRLAGGFIATVGGMVNDRSRGAFDRLKNYRGNKVNENMTKMAAGQRFQPSNPLARGFNAATGAAGTYAKSNSKMGFLFNKNTRNAAFAQQRALNAMAYAKTDAAQVAAENDPLLRAQTYASEAEARRHMIRDFGMYKENKNGTGNYNYDETARRYVRVADGTGKFDEDTGSLESAVSAAKANGGFGRNQQINAARRLFSTGTGYDDLRQVQTTVNRVAGSNKEMASDILGFGNAETGKVGRLDLKTGYGRQMKLYQKMQDNGGLTNEDIEEGYMDAIKGNEALQMLRGKPIAVKNVMPVITKALATAQREAVANDGEAKRLMAIANDTSQAIEVRQDAAQKATAAARKAQDNGLEAGRLTSIIDQFQQSASMYASAANTQTVYQNTEQPTVVNIRQNIKQEGSNVTLIRDSRTGQLRSVNQAVTDPITGQTRLEPQYRDENEVNIHFQRGLEEQAPRTPNDPRNSGIL